MKTIRTLAAMSALLSVMAFQCSDDILEPEDKGNETSNTPVITMSSNPVYIYPAEYDGTAIITLNAPKATEILIDTDFNVETTVEPIGEDEWKIILSDAENMNDDQKYYITVTAKNQYGEFTRKRAVYKSYLSNPFETEIYEVKAEGQVYSLTVKGNVKWEAAVTATDPSWYELSTSSSSISFKVLANAATEARTLTLQVKDDASNYLYNATFNQPRGPETQDEILIKERAAMLALNKALNVGWNTDKPHSEWGGVQVNSRGYVTNIVIGNCTGTLPEEIGDLKYCWEFLVNQSQVYGTLPRRIGEMTKLNTFAAGPHLEGNLSESSLKDIIHQFKVLWLGNNNFTGPFPEWIGDAPDNCFFHLNGNRLEGKIPDKVKNHPRWNWMTNDGSQMLWKEKQMQQQEGYILYE